MCHTLYILYFYGKPRLPWHQTAAFAKGYSCLRQTRLRQIKSKPSILEDNFLFGAPPLTVLSMSFPKYNWP